MRYPGSGEADGKLALPSHLSAMLAGYECTRDDVGHSGGSVHRLHGKAGHLDLYLKHGSGHLAGDLSDEMLRLRWLNGRIPVPTVVDFTGDSREAWLLMSSLPGTTARPIMASQSDDRRDVVDALAAFLRRLHAIPTQSCPFDSGHELRLAQARERIDAGLVDTDDFDEQRLGWTAGRVLDALHAMLPLAPDAVVTHGDFTLDNVLIQDKAVVGCIDTGRAGVADRYQDLAILWRDLETYGPALQQRFLQQYGLTAPERHKLHFHLLLDELF